MESTSIQTSAEEAGRPSFARIATLLESWFKNLSIATACAFLFVLLLPCMKIYINPLNYFLLDILVVPLLLVSVVRLISVGAYAITGLEFRAEKKCGFVPARLKLGRAQRWFEASSVSIPLYFALPALAGYLLFMATAPESASEQAAMPLAADIAMAIALCFCTLSAAAVALRSLLQIASGLNLAAIYDREEKIVVERNNAESGHTRWILVFCRRAFLNSLFCIVPCVLALPALSYLCPLRGYWPCVWTIAALAGLAGLSVCIRLAVIGLCYARYSIKHLLIFNFLMGIGVTAALKLPGDWKILPIVFLLVLFVAALAYIGAQDPEGDRYIPHFVRRQRRGQRKMHREPFNPSTPAAE